jgi:threonine aldolase
LRFFSDNTATACPEVLAALADANRGLAKPYGEDEWTARLDGAFSAFFATEVRSFAVVTGTAANALSLATLCPPYGAIFAHQEAHIAVDECGAPSFYTGGAQLHLLQGAHGKITAAQLQPQGRGVVHHPQPAAVSLTQATEAGTVYRPDEIATIAEIAHRHGLGVHLDGARFGNALLHLGCSPAAITWRVGVDAVSFGATKNGALAAEAVIFFDRHRAEEFAFRRKRAGHLFSKMRFLSAQLDAYLADGLWLANARAANARAAQLGAGLAALPGARLRHPVEANEVFVELPDAVIRALAADGFGFYRWMDAASLCIRLVTAFDTAADDVDRFIAACRRLLESR